MQKNATIPTGDLPTFPWWNSIIVHHTQRALASESIDLNARTTAEMIAIAVRSNLSSELSLAGVRPSEPSRE
jgi:hypothetical protein